MSHTLHHRLHQRLVQLRGRAAAWVDAGRADGFKPVGGICDNLVVTKDEQAFLSDLMALWPSFSGDRGYPVPHPVRRPAIAYINASSQEMWSPEYEYARNRWALLDWLIEQTATDD